MFIVHFGIPNAYISKYTCCKKYKVSIFYNIYNKPSSIVLYIIKSTDIVLFTSILPNVSVLVPRMHYEHLLTLDMYFKRA